MGISAFPRRSGKLWLAASEGLMWPDVPCGWQVVSRCDWQQEELLQGLQSAGDGGLSRAVTAETEWTGGARAPQDGASVGPEGERRRGSSCKGSPAVPWPPLDRGARPQMPGDE